MSKCPFISRDEALHYANWEGAYKVALLIEDVPDPDPDELQIAAATLIAMRKQLGLRDDMIYNLQVELKSGVEYIIKCEKKVKEAKNND